MRGQRAENPIRAAGGVLWRAAAGGGVEVAVIGRPRYGDWSLPKGKLNPGEAALAGALREVEEETGQRAWAGAYLGEVRYPTARGEKVVEYWALEALGGAFVPGDEVDEVRWLPPEQAARALTHDRDREVLERFADGAAVADP